MTIKHLVISGGGPTLIKTLASLQELERKEFVNRKDIQTVYGTSAGAILGVIYCINMEWEMINDYFIKRPWHELFKIKVHNILDAYSKKGIFDHTIIEKCFKPLFNSKDISLDISLEDFFEYSKIELHLITFELNYFQTEDISYKTHPKMKLMTAIQMSASIPVIITPVCIENKCYIDGGILYNYPLKFCMEKYAEEKEEILGFKNVYNNSDNPDTDYKNIHTTSTILEFVIYFVSKLLFNMNKEQDIFLKNEVIFENPLMTMESLYKTVKEIDTRKELFESGIKSAKKFLSSTGSDKQ